MVRQFQASPSELTPALFMTVPNNLTNLTI
jgi:hypothetical protein